MSEGKQLGIAFAVSAGITGATVGAIFLLRIVVVALSMTRPQAALAATLLGVAILSAFVFAMSKLANKHLMR